MPWRALRRPRSRQGCNKPSRNTSSGSSCHGRVQKKSAVEIYTMQQVLTWRQVKTKSNRCWLIWSDMHGCISPYSPYWAGRLGLLSCSRDACKSWSGPGECHMCSGSRDTPAGGCSSSSDPQAHPRGTRAGSPPGPAGKPKCRHPRTGTGTDRTRPCLFSRTNPETFMPQLQNTRKV